MAKALDLVGRRFGNLVVISRAANNSKNNTMWNCKCDCGNTREVLGYDLTHGRVATCGCKMYLKGKHSSFRQDLTGRRFGSLTVISLSDKVGKNNNLYWTCRCDCGKIKDVSASNLRSGHTKSCGAKGCTPRPYTDITGMRFGRLTVVGRVKVGQEWMWRCLCDCGKEKVTQADYLQTGRVKSCGCLGDESRRVKGRPSVKNRIYKTGTDEQAVSTTRLYREWKSMLRRCSEKYHKPELYYKKGIRVCSEWEVFEVFAEWAMSHGYRDDLTLDRIDGNKGYSPENCRWATQKEQANNTSVNVNITINGETRTLKQWSEFYGLPYSTVKARLRNGWPVERLFIPKLR